MNEFMNEFPCESREMTLMEEIENLPIDGSVKERIYNKAMKIVEVNMELNRYLENCHTRMKWLEDACVELAVLVAKQKAGAE